MANHKLTILRHPAYKKIQTYLDHKEVDSPTRRIAFADGVVAISGMAGVRLAAEQYGIDLESEGIVERFLGIMRAYGVSKEEVWDLDACAEAHLWMTLAGRHSRYVEEGQAPRHRHRHPRHLDAWVFEIDGKNRPKEDSPCRNCRQWVRREFQTVNGTS